MQFCVSIGVYKCGMSKLIKVKGKGKGKGKRKQALKAQR
jgi:hypothetical protein